MYELPVVGDACALSEPELAAQMERYRRVAVSASSVAFSGRRVEVTVGADVNDGLVAELVATERGCCPFFELQWDPAARRLAVAVARGEDEPALAVIAGALGAT